MASPPSPPSTPPPRQEGRGFLQPSCSALNLANGGNHSQFGSVTKAESRSKGKEIDFLETAGGRQALSSSGEVPPCLKQRTRLWSHWAAWENGNYRIIEYLELERAHKDHGSGTMAPYGAEREEVWQEPALAELLSPESFPGHATVQWNLRWHGTSPAHPALQPNPTSLSRQQPYIPELDK